jgi:protein-tyrosine kinase
VTPIFPLSSAHTLTSVWGRTSSRTRPRQYGDHLERLQTSEQWARGCETLACNLAARPEEIRSLLMTSPQSGTETTAALVGLGLCMARLGRSVVLVEANFRHASFESIFGAADERSDRAPAPGLADFIEGRASQSEIETCVDVHLSGASASLRIITSGRMSARGFAPLGSPRLKPLFQSWRDDGSFVLVDSPPVLEVSDALLIAPRVDGVLLVLPAGSVREKDARKAKSWLETAGTRVVGSIIWV